MILLRGCKEKREREREMQGSNQSKGDLSPLTTQLQQAWLQSQIPKVQKRRLSTMIPAPPAQSRLGSSYSYFAAESFADSGYLSSIFPGLARSSQQQQLVPTTQKPSSAAFLQRSCDQSSSGFPERPVLPMLSSYSTKTSNFPARRAAASSVRNIHHPHRSLSTSIVEGSGLEDFSGLSSSQRRASSSSFLFSANLSFPPSRYSVQPSSNALLVPGAAARCLPELDSIAASDSPLSAPLLDNILCMDEDMVQAKNIAESSLMGHNSVPETSSSSSTAEIVDHDNSWIDDMILGTLPEQQTAQAQTAEWLIQEYTRSLSVLVADVSRASQSLQSPGNLWENGLDSSYSEYMFEVLNVDQYIEREAQAPARIDYRQSLPSLESHETLIPSAAKCWFEATSYAPDLPRVDLADLLLRCAKLVEKNDVRKANDLIGELREHSSAYGNGVQRMAYYFMEALVARLSGTGGRLYAAVCGNCPPPAKLLKAYRLYVDNVPYTKLNHLFSTATILDAFKGASCVHVIDYGINHGVQWPCLIQHLATRPEGPPHLRITGIDRQQPGFSSSERVIETGHRLTEFAKMWQLPFEYHAFAEKWENITTAQLALRHDEVLAVNCFKLHYLLDESVMVDSPRKIVLNRIRSLNPKVFIEGVVSAGYNAPFFMSRYHECMKHFSVMFDAVEGSLPPDDPDRVLLERERFGREILNIVACEGLERVERAESYRQWQSRTQRAGFIQRPLNLAILSQMKAMMGSYHKDFGIGEDGGWILTGWKNHIVHGLSAWEPNPLVTNH